MKKVKVEDSIGMVLGHDLTKIIPGEYKGAAFKKGYIIQETDIEALKSMGKDHIYLLELGPDQIHENEAAVRMARAAAGCGIVLNEPGEGKVSFLAETDGLLKIDRELVEKINSVEQVSLATLHGNTPVKAGQVVAGTRIIPLVTDRYRIEKVEQLLRDRDAIRVLPFKKLKVGAVVCGSEVFYGRIQDKFAPVIKDRMHDYGAELLEIRYAPDDMGRIREQILDLVRLGAEVVLTGGGMSVDPDDVTPDAIRAAGAEIVTYGAPVLPGAMFMMAYIGDVAVMGVPACGMYHKITIFDLIFPRILAGERITKLDIASLGYGGLCMQCDQCRFPACSFGKV